LTVEREIIVNKKAKVASMCGRLEDSVRIESQRKIGEFRELLR